MDNDKHIVALLAMEHCHTHHVASLDVECPLQHRADFCHLAIVIDLILIKVVIACIAVIRSYVQHTFFHLGTYIVVFCDSIETAFQCFHIHPACAA